MSINNIIHGGVKIPLLRDIMKTQHGELTNLQDLLGFPRIEHVLRIIIMVSSIIYVSLIYYVML